MSNQPPPIRTSQEPSSHQGTMTQTLLFLLLPSSHPTDAHVSPSAQAGADRAMRHTNSWTPSIPRRQSWSPQDQKHELHMAKIEIVETNPGFSER